ncbi:MAG: TatD family hydrolase [Thermoplasmataceae archaeon]
MDFKKIAQEYLIFDNHFHLRPSGRFLDAVKMFRQSGGKALNLTNISDYSRGANGYYEKTYEETLRMAKMIRSQTGVKCAVTLGPYPLDFFFFQESGADPAAEMSKGLSLAAKIIEQGNASAIGEVGRPHFPNDMAPVFNEFLCEVFSIASDINCPVILHTEDLTEETVLELESLAMRENLNPELLIKHHAMPANLAHNSKMRFSIPASRSMVRDALKYSYNFFLETDYVDDPSKGWKVLPPDSVPKRAEMIAQTRSDWERIFSSVFLDLPTKYFGNLLSIS